MLAFRAGAAPAAHPGDAVPLDLLAATFWPEAALLGARPAHPEAEPAPHVTGEEADEAACREGFWSMLLQHLWRSPEPA